MSRRTRTKREAFCMPNTFKRPHRPHANDIQASRLSVAFFLLFLLLHLVNAFFHLFVDGEISRRSNKHTGALKHLFRNENDSHNSMAIPAIQRPHPHCTNQTKQPKEEKWRRKPQPRKRSLNMHLNCWCIVHRF